MRSKSPEKRGRQKVVPPPTYRIENEYNPEATPQCFQISINILEGRNFAWSKTQSANSYVVLVLGKKKYNTSIRRNMLEPHYKESFIFEIFTNIQDIWKSSIWMAVMEPKCCTPPRILGEVNIDLGAVWLQPNHQIRNKWVQLSSPRHLTPEPVGFLKVDLSIIRREEVIAGSSIMNDHRSQSNLLLPLSCEQQCAKYVITVYGAFGLPNCGYNEKRLRKPPSTFVTVSFCDIMAKTTIKYRTNNPQYCEKISITEMFPNICQTIKFEICFNDGCFNRVLTSAQLNLTHISHQGENGFLPTFGPSLLHMYGMLQSRTSQVQDCDDGPYFCGSLFITLKTIVPFYEQPIERLSIDPVAYIKPENLWQLKDFCIICPILEVSLLSHDIVENYCGIAITVGDIWIDNDSGDEFSNIIMKARFQKLHYTGNIEVSKNESEFGYLDFSNTYPILQFPIKLIDLRFKFYRNNMIYSIVHNLELVALSVEKKLKYIDPNCLDKLIDQLNIALDCASKKMEKFLDIVQYSGPIADEGDIIRQCFTELDQKQLSLQKEEISKIYQKICNRKTTKKDSINSRKLVKLLLADTQNLSHDLKSLICKNVADWPNITVWLLNQGSRVAYGKIKTSDIIHSSIPDQNGKDCGRVQSIYMKPLKCSKHANIASCYCYSCKVELLLWMGLYQQQSVFHYNINEILPGYKLKVKENVMHIKCTAMIVECRAFIYKAKLRNILNELTSLKTFIRLNALNTAKETKVKSETLTPTWNQVLKIQRMAYMTPGRLVNNPPIVLVEVYSTELSNNIELIGRSQITPTVSENEDYDHAPTLQWYNLYRGVEHTGQVLMSVQILQVPEKLVKKLTYSPVAESFTADEPKALQYFNSIEPLPKNLLPLSTPYKVDVYWWGLRNVGIAQKPGVMLEIDDLNFKSDIIYDKELNSNFPNGKASHTFEAPLDGPYCPLLRITLFDSGTFGRTSYLGINTTKNPNKYIVNWWPKNKRDASLNRASIVSTEFVQTNPNLFVKISGEKLKEKNNYGSNATITSSFSNLKTKRTKWRDLFWRKEPDEEEYTLLPIFVSEKHDNQNKLLHKNSLNEEQIDWWQKYLLSQSDSDDNYIEDKLIIYDSELEKQPEFSKFRDWCSALKLYNGKKTGIPEKDEQIYCGILKAGIAIYRWPPHDSMVAVTSSGLDLNKGYYNNHPNNDPLKFIIRVYIVKGIHLKTKGFAGKSNPYVILNCGGKYLGDRNNYLPNTFNPIFGKMYEFRCCLPADYLLEISLYDYGTTDELIGSTSIDLEDRIYTKHRARVGLPFEYSRKGPFKWRDCMKPSEILEELCVENHLPAPIYTNNTITVNGIIYKDNEQDESPMSASERKENLCLSILRKWHTLPICGCHLVTEHVETRALYDAGKPGVEQGKLQMWVDIMPLDIDTYIPPPVDITPKKIEDYELRVVIYTVRDIMKGYSSSVTSNIYIRAWLGSNKQSQITDVLYNCKGEANFNWRMKFNFQYQPAIQKIIYIEKGTFTEYEENIHPMLVVQLMDYEATPPYDCFGLIKLNLTAMSRGANKINECSLHVLNSPLKLNLFSTRNFSSWWPLRSMSMDQIPETTQLAGKMYMELSLLSQEKAILIPFTLGRDSSLPLPKPIRSEKSTRGLINKIRRIFHINYCYSVVLIFCFIVAFSLVVVTVYRKWSRTMTFPTHYHGI